MRVTIKRLKDDGKSTIGIISIDGTFQCFTLEDTFNEPKVYGKTRIPAGIYDLKLRTKGGMSQRYAKQYPDMHRGMLWLQDVENFEWIYIHTGNSELDTEGCILIGDVCNARKGAQRVQGSVLTYQKLYPIIADAMFNGEKCEVEVIDP